MPGTEFEKAAIEVEMVSKAPTNDEMLELYKFFKIARGEEAKKAGMFDLAGKAKYNAWNEAKDKYTPEEAEKAYIETVEKVKAARGFDATATKKADGKPIDDAKLKRYAELTA